MPTEKTDSILPPKTTAVAAKRRITGPKDEIESNPEKPPQKTKLSVRDVGGSLNIGEEESGVVAEGEKREVAEKKVKKSRGKENNFFEKVSYRLDGIKDEAPRSKSKGRRAKTARGRADVRSKGGKKREKEERPIGLYRKIFAFFVVLTVVLLAAAFYFFFVSLTIEITPKKERLSDKLSLVIRAGNKEEGANLSGQRAIEGSVERIPVREKMKFTSTGAEILGKEIIGRVSIINNYSQSKTLVATTRLLSPAGKLFRIKERVEIPAGASREVEIYADEPGEDMALGPTEFTIPGLWAGLQDKIFARSSQPFVYKTRVRNFVQAIDIEKAKQTLKDELAKKVSEQFSGNYKGFDKVVAKVDEGALEASSSAKAKDEVSEFAVSLSAFVNVVAFQSAEVEKMVQEKLASMVSGDMKTAELEKDKIEYNLTGADFKAGTASLEVPFVGVTALYNIDNIVKREKLVGLSEAQIRNYLRNLDKFSDFKLIFWPSFVKKAPTLVDRIKIVIK
jgi:hypothetical protein